MNEVGRICASHLNAADVVGNAVIIREKATLELRCYLGSRAEVIVAGSYVHWGIVGTTPTKLAYKRV